MEAVVLGGIGVIGATFIASDYTQVHKIQSCIDSYILTHMSDRDFVQCMKGQFPSKFADAYKRKIQSDAKIVEENQ